MPPPGAEDEDADGHDGGWVGGFRMGSENSAQEGDLPSDFEPEPGFISYCILVVYCRKSMICLYWHGIICL